MPIDREVKSIYIYCPLIMLSWLWLGISKSSLQRSLLKKNKTKEKKKNVMNSISCTEDASEWLLFS